MTGVVEVKGGTEEKGVSWTSSISSLKVDVEI